MRIYEGLTEDLDEALELTERLERIVAHFGAAGVRAEGQKPGVKMDAVNTLKRELRAMQQCIPARETVG